MAWDFNPDTSERTSRFAIKLSRFDEGEFYMSLHLYWTKNGFLGGVFSAKIENVIFDPSSCNESGTTESQKSDFFDFYKPFGTSLFEGHNSKYRHAKMVLARVNPGTRTKHGTV